jgi:hypothetical protein
LGKVEGKDCSKKVQRPSSNECSCQEEVVGVDEGALGSEEKGEGIAQSFGIAVLKFVYSRPPSADNEPFETPRLSAGRYHHIIG